MEKIFSEYRTHICDRGFTEGVLTEIQTLVKPSKRIYRTPTILTAMAAAAAIVILTLTVGLDTMNQTYTRIAESISLSENIDAQPSIDDLDFEVD